MAPIVVDVFRSIQQQQQQQQKRVYEYSAIPITNIVPRSPTVSHDVPSKRCGGYNRARRAARF